MDIGTALRRSRRQSGLTQQELADLAGLSRQTIVQLERGLGRMSSLNAVAPHIAFRMKGVAKGARLQDQLADARRRRGLTQFDLAARAGLSIPTVRSIERGRASLASLSAVMKVLAPSATSAERPRAYWQEKNDVRFTPPELVEEIVQAFGPISIDPAGDPRSFISADRVLTEEEDGLTTRWAGSMAFINPPFSDLARWMQRCCDAWDGKEVDKIVGLFPARTETVVFRERIFGTADVILLPRRLAFYNHLRMKMHPAPFALMLCVWGATKAEIQRFVGDRGALVIWADDRARAHAKEFNFKA
jgi:transcriptional regulator with XRE-family HTH domain